MSQRCVGWLSSVAMVAIILLELASCRAEVYTERVHHGSAVGVAYYRCGYLEKIEVDSNGDGTIDVLQIVMEPGSIRDPSSWSPKETYMDTDADGAWDIVGMQRMYSGKRGAMCWVDSDSDGTYDEVLYGNEAIKRCWSEGLGKIPWVPPASN